MSMDGTKVSGRAQHAATSDERPTGACKTDIVGSERSVVFVIDDSADVREGIKQLVESVGLRCEVFASPKEFLRTSPIVGPACLILTSGCRG